MAEKSNIRIVDIARLADVSVATVDRVIHNRGKVSDENLAKITNVLREVGYEPNLLARSLASGREYTICVLIPAFAAGEYWADVDAGVARAAEELERFHITVRRVFFDQYDRQSFARRLNLLRGETFDAVLIAPLFPELVVPFTCELDGRKVPYVFIDSTIPGCHQAAYFGCSSFDAGAVAARLLTGHIGLHADIVVGSVVPAGDAGSNQWRNRELGFRDCLRQVGYRGRIREANLHLHGEKSNKAALDALFLANPRIAGAVTFNSTCHLLGGYLSARGRRDVRLVGYDLIRRNEEMLCEGSITALIAQRPQAQGYHGVMALYETLIGGRKVLRINHLPIDILLKENIRYYKTNIL